MSKNFKCQQSDKAYNIFRIYQLLTFWDPQRSPTIILVTLFSQTILYYKVIDQYLYICQF